MPSKLSRYCTGVIEAAWLSVIILVPLFFNVYSSRIFEPDKIAILRSIALLILGAWIVKIVEESGRNTNPSTGLIKFITKTPLLLPVIGLAVVYVIATIFSVTPRVSFWGSYQRLQGTYTTFSYLVVFAAMVGNIRKRAQVERILTVMILASLPVALYGVLQRYKIDPVPWGGDTSLRIASNMGNSIFVAAYLIMVFPLTVGRIVESFRAILGEETRLGGNMAKATSYIFIGALQVIALYLSGSRGPALGWMAGTFFLVLLLSLHYQKRWLTLGIVGAALIGSVLLTLFNIPNGPFESLRSSPAIGRFGHLLDAESNSALVRKYIWQGAAELVSPHEPLEYPDGKKDVFNFIRPLIGYGPESMYVAYNPFYVPELAHVEKRNASPDRSHNETWDSLVITGALGIIVYLAIFTSVFYYGLKWLGLVPSRKQRILFFTLLLGGGTIGALGLSLWRGAEYFGVGIPFGMLIGLLFYLTIVAIFFSYRPPESKAEATRSLTLIILVSAIVAHFVEINFGIAIAVTRTYFWVFSALLLVVGHLLPMTGEYATAVEEVLPGGRAGRTIDKREASVRRKRRGGKSGLVGRKAVNGDLFRSVLVPAVLISTVLVTLGYDFISNPRNLSGALEILWTSLTRLPNRNFALSYGILTLLATTWLVMAVVLVAEGNRSNQESWWRRLSLTLGISALLTLIFWVWHAGSLGVMARSTASTMAGVMAQVARYEGLLAKFYAYIFFLVLLAAYYIQPEGAHKERRMSVGRTVAAVGGLILVLTLAAYTNLRVIQADIVFKLAGPFTRGNSWPVAIEIYNHANELAPNEDYYYLFLGRAYLEHAKTLADENERQRLISQAEKDLKKAQKINPLNTDHTANLARLYSLWASYVNNPEEREKKGEISADYFSRAVTLSPNNARIWDEWALLFLNILNEPEEAYQRLMHALDIDQEYHWTYALLGEYYARQARSVGTEEKATLAYQKAADYYARALDSPTPGEPQAKYNYALALGGVRAQLGDMDGAREAYLTALEKAPRNAEVWRVEEALASLYAQQKDWPNALLYAQSALGKAPEGQRERLQTLIQQLQQFLQ